MKIIIYDRVSKLAKINPNSGLIDTSNQRVSTISQLEEYNNHDWMIRTDYANRWEDQTDLHGVLEAVNKGPKEGGYSLLVCSDLFSLVSASTFQDAVICLAEVEKVIPVTFVHYYGFNILQGSHILALVKEYQQARRNETNQLTHFLQRDTLKGRPKLDIDFESAARMRGQGMTYRHIASALGCSAALIYEKLPKEKKAEVMARMGRNRVVKMLEERRLAREIKKEQDIKKENAGKNASNNKE